MKPEPMNIAKKITKADIVLHLRLLYYLLSDALLPIGS
jgi:hypothetical protein